MSENIKTKKEDKGPWTYCSPGLIDWKMRLKVGRAVVVIDFTGGYMSSNGVISGKFTTPDPALKRLIEESPQFQQKRVEKWE